LKATLLNMRCRCRLPIVCLTHTYLHTAPGWAWQMAGKPKA